ncbi:DoxX-like family protein [Hydrobacter penzbergensis]|uniref:DoxX-like family protein n=1 Tax=Hydrobacter penzbergensis TaxID=1235997 RepID=A0A8X8IEW5_9BACT|nr:DoxX family protein [Hydrobacter penzbergensis]SDW73481.1 DoxX-like family protein [Hydrobacter penzbergensis]
MKKVKIAYWIVTGILCLMMTFSGIVNAMSTPESITLFKYLGYPNYLIPFLGIAKLLAVVAILFPGFPRLKEWAYAGLIIDFTGALYSSISVGDPASQWSFILIGHLLVFASYILYHKKKAVPAS